FRGDPSVLQPGLDELTARTGIGFAGVIPWLPDLELDAEDTLEVGRWRKRSTSDDSLRIAVVRLPRVSNVTDIDALATEPGVEVLVTTNPAVVCGADLAILPGSRATCADLHWLRRTGLAEAIMDRSRRHAPVLGICGGFQMLTEWIEDGVESGDSEAGLGLLPATVRFSSAKILGRPSGNWRGAPVEAYEIHHGVATATGAAEPFLGGWRLDQTWGTMWHGALENDDFRRGWLTEIAAATGSAWRAAEQAPGFAARREAMIDQLADAVDEHVDVEMIVNLAEAGTRSSR
ncbi:MAG: cobyric acid synthase CobQ, partial [Propionibacteriaceae bacterium]|nr:cobyric acid synthase CobQ [Propionibacteriaceae bacterium]